MEFHSPLYLFLILLTTLLSSSQARKFNVGGSGDWVPNPSENYNQWSGRNRFLVNDTIVFKYQKGVDSVLEVNREDYDKCNKNNPIKKFEDGNTEFKFDRSGPFYFISGKNGSCENGQKMIVVVLTPRPPKQSPSPPSPPKSSPSPSPSTPASPPSPAGNPPSTSPSPVVSPVPGTSPPVPSPATSPAPAGSSPFPSPTKSPAPAGSSPLPSPASNSPSPSPSSASPGGSPVSTPPAGSPGSTPPAGSPGSTPPAGAPGSGGVPPINGGLGPEITPDSGKSDARGFAPSMLLVFSVTVIVGASTFLH